MFVVVDGSHFWGHAGNKVFIAEQTKMLLLYVRIEHMTVPPRSRQRYLCIKLCLKIRM